MEKPITDKLERALTSLRLEERHTPSEYSRIRLVDAELVDILLRLDRRLARLEGESR